MLEDLSFPTFRSHGFFVVIVVVCLGLFCFALLCFAFLLSFWAKHGVMIWNRSAKQVEKGGSFRTCWQASLSYLESSRPPRDPI